MTTNILTFRNQFLIKFLNYQIKHKTNLNRYYLSWLRLNVNKPPKSYIPKPSSRLSSNKIVIQLPNWSYPISGAFYLSFEKQKKFEIIVNESFTVTVLNSLFINHNKNEINNNIYQIIEKYNLNIDCFEMIKKKYYRLRKNTK